MIGIIVTGHGLFAYGIEKAVERIIGEQLQVAYVNFPIESSTEILQQQLTDAIAEVDQGDGIVFFTDLLGGTPFRTAALLSHEMENCEVLTGINLQMTIETMLERDEKGMTVAKFRELALKFGQRGMTSLHDELAAKQAAVATVEEDDGI